MEGAIHPWTIKAFTQLSNSSQGWLEVGRPKSFILHDHKMLYEVDQRANGESGPAFWLNNTRVMVGVAAPGRQSGSVKRPECGPEMVCIILAFLVESGKLDSTLLHNSSLLSSFPNLFRLGEFNEAIYHRVVWATQPSTTSAAPSDDVNADT